jgi:hypothetical protein
LANCGDSLIEGVDYLLGRIGDVPEAWNSGKKGKKSYSNHEEGEGLECVPCCKYKDVVNAWRKALLWTDGLDRALACMLASVASTQMLGDQLWLKVLGPAACGKSTLCEGAGADTKFTTGAGEVLSRDEILEEAQNAGVLRGGFFESEFKRELFKKPSWNVLDAENRFVKTGEKLGAGLTAAPGQLLSGAGVGRLKQMDANAVESIDRLGHYLFKRAQGFNPDQAAQSVKKALFDYSDLNDFEKNVLGRGMFFYAYSRNVIPFMLDRAVRRPGKVAALARVGGGAGGREGLPENVPVWAREGLPIPLGKDEAGNPMIAYGLGTPLEAAVEPFSGFTEGFQRGAEKGLSMLNPIARVPLELSTGKRFFLGQNIEEARKAPAWVGLLPVEIQKGMGVRQVPMKSGGVRLEMDPYDLYALENSPFGRLSNTIGKAVDTRKPGVARALNITTGAKVVSVDEEREAYLAVKRAKEKLLKELERRGLVSEMQDLYRVTEEGKQSPQAAGLRQLVKR